MERALKRGFLEEVAVQLNLEDTWKEGLIQSEEVRRVLGRGSGGHKWGDGDVSSLF